MISYKKRNYVPHSQITHFISLGVNVNLSTTDYLSITAKASENIKAELKNASLRQDMKRLMSRLILLVVFCSVLFFHPRTCITNTNGPIYIRADGSVDPSTAPISSMDNVTYTFGGNINNSIVVERSNIIIDGNGYTLQGSGLGKGFDLSGVNNVTIKNTDISARKSGRDAHPNYGIYLYSSSFNTISGNNITDNYYAGIYLNESSNNNIIGNNITKNYHGIYLDYSSNNTIVGNNITNSGFSLPFPPIPIKTNGIMLAFSSDNFLRNNVMADSDFNFGVLGGALSDFVNDVDVSNSVDGKPVYYWVSRRDVEVPLDAGYVSLVNCTNVRIENLTLTKNMQGILLAYTNYTTIVGNRITNNWNGVLLWYSSSYNVVFGNNVTANNGVGIAFAMCSNNTASGNSITNTDDFGIYLGESPNNTVFGNNVANNGYGLGCWNSSGNLIYHNNMVSIVGQVYTENSVNFWDDDVEGNYWNDYSGVDLNRDGIGDTAYSIDTSNVDRFPLMAPISIFDAGTWNDISCKVHVISNSTVSNFQLNDTEKIISFNVTGEMGVGFCRVTIPNIIIQNMWQGNYTVLVDGEKPLDVRNWTDNTNTYIYFTYLHSEHEVVITPEIPVAAILPLVAIITLCAVVLKKIKPYKNAH